MKNTIEFTVPIGLAVILLLILKLTGQLTWPWLLILAPLWVPLALVGGILVVILAVMLLYLIGILIGGFLVFMRELLY